jgi:hypothetical protein
MVNGKMIPITLKRAPTNSAQKIILLSFRFPKDPAIDDSAVKTVIPMVLIRDRQYCPHKGTTMKLPAASRRRVKAAMATARCKVFWRRRIKI